MTGSLQPDRELISVLSGLIICARSGSFPSAYRGMEDVVPAKYRSYLGETWDDSIFDDRRNMSLFAHSLFFMVARRNWKKTAKLLWPKLTRIAKQETLLAEGADFACSRSSSASERTAFPSLPQSWDDIVGMIQKERNVSVPEKLMNDPVLTLLIVLFLPFRGSEDVVLSLDRKFAKAWY